MSLTLPPLPYALDALEPHVSRRTLGFHHGHHHAGYVQKTRALVRATPLESASLAEIVRVSATETTRKALSTPRPRRGTTSSSGRACARAAVARLTGRSRD